MYILKKPKLITIVISDFTPEAMMSIHQHNPRGIALVVDEILALFNSVRRYNNRNNLIEDLLTAYSGQPLKVIRKSEVRPILIKNPCINIIGSVQTNLLRRYSRLNWLLTVCSTVSCSFIRKIGEFPVGNGVIAISISGYGRAMEDDNE